MELKLCKNCGHIHNIKLGNIETCLVCDNASVDKIVRHAKRHLEKMGFKSDKLDTLLSWLDAADQTNIEDNLTSIRIFSDGSGLILQEGKEVGEFYTIEEAFEKLETIVNTQKS